MREGRGNCLKYFKREWNRIEGRGNKDFKKEGQAGSRRGCLKKGAGTPLRTMVFVMLILPFVTTTNNCTLLGCRKLF